MLDNNMLIAFEYGYKCCEKGIGYQQAEKEFKDKFIFDNKVGKPYLLKPLKDLIILDNFKKHIKGFKMAYFEYKCRRCGAI